MNKSNINNCESSSGILDLDIVEGKQLANLEINVELYLENTY